MKDSQLVRNLWGVHSKYIKESNERFSTLVCGGVQVEISISRRVMKDSQLVQRRCAAAYKYIKESNERFSTAQSS